MTVLKITIAALILSFSMSTAVTAQDSLWTRTYGGDWWDGANAIDATRDGGFIVAGFNSSTPGTYDRKFYLLKIDAAGDTLWTKIFGTSTKNIATSVRETADDGFIMVGRTETSPYVNDVHLIRTDQDGNILWDRRYDWYSDDRGHDVWQTSDGGFIVAGQTYVPTVPFGSYDMLLMRTDASGNMLWWQTYAFDPDTGGDYALAVQETDDGDFIVGGGTQSTVWDAILLRTDALGNLIWMKNYGLIQGVVNDVRQTADGGFILTGSADGDALLMKTDADGNSLWTRGFGGDSTDRGDSVKELSGGGYIVTGMTSGPSPPNAELYVIRTDANGDSLWTGVFGGTGDDRGHSVVQAHDGNLLVAGTTWSFGAGRGDVWLMKIADLSSVSIEAAEPSPRARLSAEPPRPNPFAEGTTIAFYQPRPDEVEVQIYNVLGRRMRTLHAGWLPAGNHELEWDGRWDSGAHAASGAYFARIRAGGEELTRALLLIR